MSTLAERLAAALKHQRAFDDDPTRQAGREAERQAGEALAVRLAGTGWQIHAGRRVPDPETRQRREIDFVITSPTEAIVVELKNWSGTDHVAAGRPSCPIRSLVAFHNPRVHLARDVASRKDVASFEALVGGMPAGTSALERALQAVFRILGFTANAPAKVSPAVKALRETLEALGTWDLVRVHGGRTLAGDVLDRHDRDLAHALGRDSDRAHVRRIEMEVGRSLVAAIFRSPPRRAHIYLRDGSTRGVLRVQPVDLNLAEYRADVVFTLGPADTPTEAFVLEAQSEVDKPGAEHIALAALAAVRDLDRDHEAFYPDFILAGLGEVARAALELIMNKANYEYQSDFARKYFSMGKAEGQAQLLLKQLRFKGFTVPPELAARVESCQDLAQLDLWAERVLTATALDDIFPEGR